MVFTCAFCNREFDANKDLKIHLSRFDFERTQVNTKIPMERRDCIEVFLPPYQRDNIYPDTEWHNISGKGFADFINRTYDNVIHWRKHLFKLPAGKANCLFINKLTIWLDYYNRSIPFKSIALKVFMTFSKY